MKKGWKFVGIMFLIILFLGAVCIGVGFLTGGDWGRIYSTLNDRFQIEQVASVYSQYFSSLAASIVG